MAEIKIKKKSAVWPWIVLIIIILAGLAFLFFYGNSEDEFNTDDNTTEFEEVTFSTPLTPSSLITRSQYS